MLLYRIERIPSDSILRGFLRAINEEAFEIVK